MFGRKPPTDGEPAATPNRIAPAPSFQAAADRTPSAPPPPRPVAVADPQGSAAQRPAPPPAWSTAGAAAPRRAAEPIRPVEPSRNEAVRADIPREVRKLIVGRDINLSGEITACDHLIVEGTVEARVRDCYRLEVAESGLFQGAVEISEADIAGRFVGDLIVHGRLSVRATGKVEGKIQYGELAVDAGGTLDGEVRVSGKGPKLVTESEAIKPPDQAQIGDVRLEAPIHENAPPPEAPNLL